MKWDREKLPEPSLHVYAKDNTKIMIYNMRRSLKKIEKNLEDRKSVM